MSHISGDNIQRNSRDICLFDNNDRPVMHCLVIRKVSRIQLIKILLSGEDGTLSKTIENIDNINEYNITDIRFQPSE